ncbi:hypothetical protein [Neisseria leonii]|uniref:hypothetical protein n=1 Tax=Neisseria leonii TaxID=2995413 RepID=UPI00237A3D23|nr:hypothetical protein [Neisseria sp. 3986]MDD9325202.1 hypothetical protein [Neisseria sp. 3986]
MEKDRLIQILAVFIETQGKDESVAALLPPDTEFERRFGNLNHFRTAFAWSLEDWILEQFAGNEQWEDLAETLSWADDDWTEAQWQKCFENLKRKRLFL